MWSNLFYPLFNKQRHLLPDLVSQSSIQPDFECPHFPTHFLSSWFYNEWGLGDVSQILEFLVPGIHWILCSVLQLPLLPLCMAHNYLVMCYPKALKSLWQKASQFQIETQRNNVQNYHGWLQGENIFQCYMELSVWSWIRMLLFQEANFVSNTNTSLFSSKWGFHSSSRKETTKSIIKSIRLNDKL